MSKRNIIRIVVICLCVISIGFLFVIDEGQASTLVKTGDRGGEVWEVQHRLQQLGYYASTLDGVFGPLTQQGTLKFQQDYGLLVDGIVGPQTWGMLRQVSLTQNEIQMLAQVVYGEARGEPYEGQVAVAAVVLNRLKSPQFPDTVEGVIFEPRAFTAIADGQYYLSPDHTSYKAVYAALAGWDPSANALYYFNPVTATSDWIWSRPQIKQIGRHIFAR